MCSIRPSNRTGLAGEERPAGASGGIEGGIEGGREELFPTVGHVTVYRGFYGEGIGRRTRTGSYDSIQDVQHSKQLEWGSEVCAARDATG